MRTIHKQHFIITPTVRISMPKNAEILHAGIQGFQATVWYLCETDEPIVTHILYTCITGKKDVEECQNLNTYLGTIQFPNGLVFHIFDGGEE